MIITLYVKIMVKSEISSFCTSCDAPGWPCPCLEPGGARNYVGHYHV